jgi:hypothetical protein
LVEKLLKHQAPGEIGRAAEDKQYFFLFWLFCAIFLSFFLSMEFAEPTFKLQLKESQV